jgi:hypothetical protein
MEDSYNQLTIAVGAIVLVLLSVTVYGIAGLH